ncbi:MAG: YidC/Oxa1 family membrane protein insertase [Planctomycetota bacterium]
MEKRLPLFLLLSFGVLMGWTVLFGPKPSPKTEQQSTPAGVVIPNEQTPADLAVELPDAVGELVVETTERETEDLIFGRHGEPGLYLARFSNRGARLLELRLGDYPSAQGFTEAEREDTENWVHLLDPVLQLDGTSTGSMVLRASASAKDLERGTPFEDALWAMKVLKNQDGSPRGVEFELAPGSGIRLIKRFLFQMGVQAFTLELELHNEGLATGSAREFILTPASSMLPELDDAFYIEPQAFAAGPRGLELDEMSFAMEEKLDSGNERVGPLTVPPPLAFAGVQNKYFAIVMREVLDNVTDEATMIGASYARVYDAAWAEANPTDIRNGWKFIETDVYLKLRLPDKGTSTIYTYEVYAGPKEREGFVRANEEHKLILVEDLGWMSTIGNLLVGVLGLLHRLTANWGTSIILLTLIIRILLFPLNRRFQTSMARYQKKMKRVQPKIAALKEEFKNDLQKQRQAQAKLMQEEKAFPPLGGCLPMFLQIPIFIGLFSALRTNFNLRHAPFAGWITDLSQPDRLLTLNFDVPIIGMIEYLNVLPILMVVLWVLQQRGMPAPADEQAARMQKMMAFMPVVMGFFLYNYAAGLSLYMITQSGLGIFEQHFIKKRWPIDDTELDVPEKKRGCGPFSGFMENIAAKQKEHLKRMESMQKNQPKGGGSKKRKKR